MVKSNSANWHIAQLIMESSQMESSSLLGREIIKNTIAQHAEKKVDNPLMLWEKMADEIISLVGEGGFNSLYARSVHLTQATFPWLMIRMLPLETGYRFADLKSLYEQQPPAQASAANELLLITLTDLLTSLIGEQITIGILRSAWSNGATDSVDKELKNE